MRHPPGARAQKVVLLQIETKDQSRILRITKAATNRAERLLFDVKIYVDQIIRAGTSVVSTARS